MKYDFSSMTCFFLVILKFKVFLLDLKCCEVILGKLVELKMKTTRDLNRLKVLWNLLRQGDIHNIIHNLKFWFLKCYFFNFWASVRRIGSFKLSLKSLLWRRMRFWSKRRRQPKKNMTKKLTTWRMKFFFYYKKRKNLAKLL